MAFPSSSTGTVLPAMEIEPRRISMAVSGEAARKHAIAREGTGFPSKIRNSRTRR